MEGKLLKNSVTFAEPPFTRFPFHTIVVFSEYNFDMSYKRIEYNHENYNVRPSHLQSEKFAQRFRNHCRSRVSSGVFTPLLTLVEVTNNMDDKTVETLTCRLLSSVS